MNKYRHLSWNICVPNEWPVEAGQQVLEELLKKVIDYHGLGHKIVITIKGVSALVVGKRYGFLFEKIKEINNDDAYLVDALLPVEVSLVKLERGRPNYSEKIPVWDLSVKLVSDHPFSDLFVSRSDRHTVVTAVPLLNDIFESKGIEGEKVNKYALQIIYKTHKGLIPRRRFVEPESEEHPFVAVKDGYNAGWEIECYYPPTQRSWWSKKTAHLEALVRSCR